MSIPKCACGFVLPGPLHGQHCTLYNPSAIYGNGPYTEQSVASHERKKQSFIVDVILFGEAFSIEHYAWSEADAIMDIQTMSLSKLLDMVTIQDLKLRSYTCRVVRATGI